MSMLICTVVTPVRSIPGMAKEAKVFIIRLTKFHRREGFAHILSYARTTIILSHFPYAFRTGQK